MKLAISFTNFGPYHLARLRAMAVHLREKGGTLVAYETASIETKYPWRAQRDEVPFEWRTLFPHTPLEHLPRNDCQAAMLEALELDQPDAVAVAGYVRPEALAAAAWARKHRRPAVLMSESQACDRPRTWWKEAVKRHRIARFDAALVGGPSHARYLESLGMPADRIAFGYNVVDNEHFAERAMRAKLEPQKPNHRPSRPYYLVVCRFVPEKNLARLLRSYARYREEVGPIDAWDLVLCGDGPDAPRIEGAIHALGLSQVVHRPGFLQVDELPRWYAAASAFVLPSLSEPWGLVVNEAAACGLPLLVSDRAGCVETLVPDSGERSGWRLEPYHEEQMAASLRRMSTCSSDERAAMGRRAFEIVSAWSPSRFAAGMIEALERSASICPLDRARSRQFA